MTQDTGVDVYRKLENAFTRTAIHRPMHLQRYEAGTDLVYHIKGIRNPGRVKVRLVIEKFVGGGFAGQVYRVKLLDMESDEGSIDDLIIGQTYAVKILIPPSGFSRLFRNALYWIGFQGPFQLQVNPAAARAGALWQKFIRQAAATVFGEETAVVDIYATFVDQHMGSCGELSEWVDGRTWRLEVDDHLDRLKRWFKGRKVDVQQLGSPEYRAKYEFMRRFVALLHHIGAHEFARQYEWSTWKSQPNCLKRSNTEALPSEGLTAVDFRAGLALLPFLPMSPGDFKLIITGIMRASLVQFDRGSLTRLKQFTQAHPEDFAGTQTMLEELESCERVYRNSVPDVTHNHVRLLYSRRLWSTMLNSAAAGWKVRNLISNSCRQVLKNSTALTLLFAMLGVIPIAGRFIRRIWGQPFWRTHYRTMLTSSDYLRRAVRAKFIEKIIDWHRAGRIDDQKALRLPEQIWPCCYHLMLAWLPAGLHHFLTDASYARQRLEYITLRPVRLYFNNALREQWLRDMVTEGKGNHLLTDEDAQTILSQIKEPYIQKYLKSLAVHVCTLPVTQVVSVLTAILYVLMHPEVPRTQAYGIGLGIIALFQVVPISPGSLTRGLYVLYLVIREKNFKDYNIAVFLGFFKYIGYLAFPIQMTYRYPALARFMAGYWATEAVHVVPVFGERGALLEHKIFNLFYNWPLTIRRRMQTRSRIRATQPHRYWHMALCALAGTGIFMVIDRLYAQSSGQLPDLEKIWFATLAVPALCGVAATLGAGGAPSWKRIAGAALCGAAIGGFSIAGAPLLAHVHPAGWSALATTGAWRVFIFALLAVSAVLVTEVKLPDAETG